MSEIISKEEFLQKQSAIDSARNQLKIDVIDYMRAQGVEDTSLWAQGLDVVKACWDVIPVETARVEAASYIQAVERLSGPLDDKADFYFRVSWSFSPPHYRAIVGFIQRYEALQEEMGELEQAVSEYIDQQRWWIHSARDDFELEDFEPVAEAIVYPDRILVTAFQQGYGDVLPRGYGRKHLEGMQWQFDLSALEALKRIGSLAFLYHPAVDRPIGVAS